MNSYNLAFYTYFYGSDNNTAFQIPELPSLKYNCYYYTNNLILNEFLKATKWIAIYVEKPTTDDLIESSMIGKHTKVMSHEYSELKDYDYLCFLDNKAACVNEEFVENFIHKYFIENNYALLIKKHMFINDNVWNEYNESMFQKRYQLESEKYRNYIAKQVSVGLSVYTKQHCQTGFMIKNMKHKKMIEINTIWFKHIQECGIQCQISFHFVKQLFDEFIYPFTDSPYH